jgi:hypothetical protein
MRAWANIRWGRRTWHICPWVSVRAALVTLVTVVVVAIAFDHLILAGLERRGLVASDGWKRHNRVVIENDERKDRHWAVPRRVGAISTGVRAWLGHPVTPERTKGHRLLVMGDSFIWGSPYLTLNHMWWRQLGIELKRRGYHDVEVIAAGSPGMSTHEQLDLARKIVPKFKPDLILWGFVTNDPDERMVKQIHSSQLAPPIPGKVQSVLKYLTPRLLDLVISRRNEKLTKSYLGPKYGYEYSDWLKRIHEGENFDAYQQTVKNVGLYLEEAKTPGVLVTLPESPLPDRFAFSYDKVLPLWREAGIPVIDPLPAMVAKYPNAETTGPKALVWGINPADGHPGPRSTAFLAKQTADRLEQDYAQFLGPKTTTREAIRINDWLPFDLDLRPLSNGGDGENPEKFELTYPDTGKFLPTMPLEVPTVLVSFEQPVPLRKIRLSGPGLNSGRVWLSTYDLVEGYDTEEWKDLGVSQGNDLTWLIPDELSGREASVILLRGDVTGVNRRLVLEIQ